MNRIVSWLVGLTAGTALLIAHGEALTVNGDFSKLDKNNFPQQWTRIAPGGARAAQVADEAGKNVPVLEFALTGGEQTRIEQRHTLNPGRIYKVAFEAKSENLSAAGVYLTTLRWSGGGSLLLKGTTPWKKYEFTTGFSGTDVHYRLILYAPQGATGKVWFRNVSVSEVIPEISAESALLGISPFDTPPAIDGSLDDAVWRSTVQASPFVRLGKYDHTEFAQDDTVFMTGYDREWLYVAFRCFQRCLDPVRNELEHFRNKCTDADGDVFKDDCVILLIQPDSSPEAPVYEFTVNASGTVADAVCRGRDLWTGRDLGYTGNARVKTQIGNGVFQIEMAIPWKTLGNVQPVPGKTFKMLAGRTDHDLKESTVYFPAADGFHRRAALGEVKLLKSAVGIGDFKTGLTDAGDHRFSCAVEEPLQVRMTAMGEGGRRMEKDAALKTGRNQVAYMLPGSEYNSAGWIFSGASEPVWRTPVYTVLNSVKNLELADAAGVRKFSGAGGLYPMPPIQTPFSLSEQGLPESRMKHARAPEQLAVDVTRFWPENGNRLYLAAGTLQPLQVVFSSPLEKLADQPWKLHLFLPELFELHSATALKSSPYRPVVKELGTEKHGANVMRHYEIDARCAQPIRAVPKPEDLLILLIAAPEKPVAGAVSAWYYAQWDDGRIVEAPGRLELLVVDGVNGKQPRRFQGEMWGGRMVNLADEAANRDFLIRAVRGSGFTQLQNFRITGLKRMGVIGVARLVAAGGIRPELGKRPEWRRLDLNGQPVALDSPTALCPGAMLTDPELRKMLEQGFIRQMSNFEIANFDYESPARGGALSCYCERCRKEFAEFSKLSEVPEIAAIDRDFRTQWRDFMTSRIAECCTLFREFAHANGRELSFYSGYQSPKTLDYYTVDWNKLAGRIDTGSAGYHGDFATIAKTVAALKGTPLLCGVIAEPWHEYLRQKNIQISAAELAVGLMAGGKGFICYNLPGLDGRSFRTFSRFNSLLADHEDLLYDGVRSQKGLAVEGIPQDGWMLFTHPEKGQMLIAANCGDQPAVVRVRHNPTPAVDYFSGRRVAAGGFEFEIPAGEMAAWSFCNGK